MPRDASSRTRNQPNCRRLRIAKSPSSWCFNSLTTSNCRSWWQSICVYFTAAYGYLFCLPTIVKTITRVNLTRVDWLSAAPLLASVAGVYRYCVMAMAGFGICFWCTTWFPAHLWLSYALLVLAGMFSKGMMSPFWSMPSVPFPSGVSGGARGIINGIGNICGFAGPVLVGWLAHWTSSVQSSAAAVSPAQVSACYCRKQQRGGVITGRPEIWRISPNERFFMHDSGRLKVIVLLMPGKAVPVG